MRGAKRHSLRAVALLIGGCTADPQLLVGRDGGAAVSDAGAILADEGERDASADSGAMSDGARTDASEHRCEPDEPAGPLPAVDCGDPVLRDDLPVVCADLEPCSEDGDCMVAVVDPCCGLTLIAILASRADEVSEAVGECLDHPAPECPPCPPRQPVAACVEGRCRILRQR